MLMLIKFLSVIFCFCCVGGLITVGSVQVVTVFRFVSLMTRRVVCVTQVVFTHRLVMSHLVRHVIVSYLRNLFALV